MVSDIYKIVRMTARHQEGVPWPMAACGRCAAIRTGYFERMTGGGG